MSWPFNNEVIRGRRDINPMPSMPAEQYERSIDPPFDTPAPAGGGSAPAVIYPFDITFSAGSDSSHAKATIQPGTLNGLIPSNYTTTYDLDITTTYYLVLSVTATDGAITGCSLSMPTTAPSPIPVLMGAPPTSFDYLLGVVISKAWFRVIGNGSLTANGQEVFRVSKTSPAPGTLPYDIYYTWSLVHN